MRPVSKRLRVFAAVVLSLCASTGLCQTDSGSLLEHTSVLLITIDTLRADHLGCYGARGVRTPAMDALAAQGTRFEMSLAQVPITLPSHTVILTGTYPMYNGERDFTSPTLPANVGVLAEAFQRHGYDTAAFVSAFVLDSTWGLNRGFQTYDDHFDPEQFQMRNPSNIERRADKTVERLPAWLQTRGQRGTATRPFFVWVHLYDPHSPYNPPEPFRSQYAGHLYDGEVAFTDSQLARLFAALRSAGLYDRTLIVLTADHGESLGEHGEDEHSYFIYNATLRVPLIFKLPRGMGQARVVRRVVGTVDVAPTILGLLHMRDPLDRQFQGTSLASDILGKGPASPRPIYSETYYPRDSFGWSELRCVTSDQFKYIQAPHPELYDIRADPEELHNLYAERGSLAAALREQLEGIERRYASGPTQANAAGPPLSPETVEKLKSLGYLAYSAPVEPASNGPLPDPKDRVNVYKAILRAYLYTSAGFEESNTLLKSLEAQEPRLHLLPFLEAENFARAHRWKEAEQSFLACLKLNPTFEQAIMGLAHLYMEEGKSKEARPWLELAVHRNPHNFLAYYALGMAARWEKNQQEAYRYFLKAVGEKPDYAFSQQELGITLVDLQRYQEALNPLSRAEKLGLENPRLEHYLGTALANVGRFKEAVERYQKALKMEPDLAEARLSLAFAYLNLGDRDSAKREFRTLCQQNASMCQQYRKQFE